MLSAHTGCCLLLVASLGTPADAPKPDFTGTWKLNVEASTLQPPPGSPDGVKGRPAEGSPMLEPMTVKQTASSLVVTMPFYDAVVTTTYSLTGAKSLNPKPAGGGAMVDAESVTKWDGDKLVVTTTWPGPRGTIRVTETWSLDSGRLVLGVVNGSGTWTKVYNPAPR